MYDFISRAFFKDLRGRTMKKVRGFALSTFGNILELGSSNINHKISAVFKSFWLVQCSHNKDEEWQSVRQYNSWDLAFCGHSGSQTLQID